MRCDRFRKLLHKSPQQEVYNSVCNYLGSLEDEAPRLFSSLSALEDLGRRLCRRPLGSDRDLESYERSAVEDHVHDVIAELCKIPDAQNEFALGEGIQFENHANTLDEDDSDTLDVGYQLRHWSSPQRSVPDQFLQLCILVQWTLFAFSANSVKEVEQQHGYSIVAEA